MSQTFAARLEGGRENNEGRAIEHHPMAGKPAPHDGRSFDRLFTRRRLKEKDKEVNERIGEKEIEQVAKAVGRAFGDHLPEISSIGTADAFLRNKYGRKECNFFFG